jgi:hypothetical protein
MHGATYKDTGIYIYFCSMMESKSLEEKSQHNLQLESIIEATGKICAIILGAKSQFLRKCTTFTFLNKQTNFLKWAFS